MAAARAQSLGAMLTDRSLLALLLPKLGPADARGLRGVCSGARIAYDQLAPSLRVRSDDDVLSLRGLLLRGCRPVKVTLGGKNGLRLLRPFTEVSASAPLPTTELAMPAAWLCLGTAQAVAAAFPQLSSLTLTRVEGSVGADATEGLSLMLGTGGAAAPLLPSLQVLSVSCNTSPILRALRGASQLRRFEVGGFPAKTTTLQVLGSLPGLRSVKLGYCSQQFLPQLLPALTSLTALDLGSTNGALPATALSGLCGLRELSARRARLDPSALQGLSSLTRLELRSLEAPYGSGATAAWRLPPGLAELYLGFVCPEVLSALHAPQGWRLQGCDVTVELEPVRHYETDDGCLLPAGEEALCGAAAVLAGRLGLETSKICVSAYDADELLKPVGGEAGPGRRNHARWLAAIGRTGVGSLQLNAIALSHQDITTIAETCIGLKALELTACGLFPAASLPQLARLPRLECVTLDVDSWSGPEGNHRMAVPAGALGSVLALCSSSSFRGVVILAAEPAFYEPAKEMQLKALVEELQGDLEAMGLERGRLVVA